MQVYSHSQSVAATTWTIHHNMNVAAVAIDVFVDGVGGVTHANAMVVPASIEHTNDNTVTVTFTEACTGSARIVG